MKSVYKFAFAALLGAFAISSQAGVIFTFEASGHLHSGGGAGGFFGPQVVMGSAFIHTVRIDLDSCGMKNWQGNLDPSLCLMASSFSAGGKTFNSPWSTGNFYYDENFMSIDYSVTLRLPDASMPIQSNLSTQLPTHPLRTLEEWKRVKNLSIAQSPSNYGNASYTYFINPDDLSIPQYMFCAETGSELVVINPVPEPSTGAMLCLAAIGLLLSRRQLRE